MDKIHIRDILLRCIIGVNDGERREKQDVVINLCLYADLRKAGRTDAFADTVDYQAVKQRVIKLVENSKFFLVEALAEAIAQICLKFPRIKQVEVRVEKPRALRLARTVEVEISRRRKQG